MQTLPTSGEFAYIVAQHLSPQHPSLLTELLGRETGLKVIEVRNNSPLVKNCVYVTPPNADVVVGNDRLHLNGAGGARSKAKYRYVA